MKKNLTPPKPVFEVEGCVSADVEDLDQAVRQDPPSFAASLQFYIGEVGQEASDVFEIVVCSNDRAIEWQRRGTPFISLPVMAPSVAMTFAQALVEHANTLDDPLAYLVSKMSWEFDGYR